MIAQTEGHWILPDFRGAGIHGGGQYGGGGGPYVR